MANTASAKHVRALLGGAIPVEAIDGGSAPGGSPSGTAATTTATPGHGLVGNDVEEQIYELADNKLDFNDPVTLVAVSGATTLTTTAFGKVHVCSGTTYTLVLPTAVSNDGDVIGVVVTATGLVTIDANGSQTINGALTFPMVVGEAVVLVASGGNWIITSGREADEVLLVALSDETTTITTGTAKATIRMPYAMYLSEARSNLNTASSSGLPTVDVKEGGTSVFSTLLTIDATEKTSTTAATPAVISDHLLADDAEITFDITVAGTGAKGLKVALIGKRA